LGNIHVVVNQPDGTTGGVVQYDLIKGKSSDERKPKGSNFFNMPPVVAPNAFSSRFESCYFRKV
jgi:hypothetical protein